MVKVTATAFSRLKRKLRRQPEGIAVRITMENGHVEFRPDKEQKGDVVFAHRGQSVLLVGTERQKRSPEKLWMSSRQPMGIACDLSAQSKAFERKTLAIYLS